MDEVIAIYKWLKTKRAIINNEGLNEDYLVNFFSKLEKKKSLEIMDEMLEKDIRKNLKICISICTRYSDSLTPENVIKLFEINC